MCISTEFPGDGLGPARPPTWENYKVNSFFLHQAYLLINHVDVLICDWNRNIFPQKECLITPEDLDQPGGWGIGFSFIWQIRIAHPLYYGRDSADPKYSVGIK